MTRPARSWLAAAFIFALYGCGNAGEAPEQTNTHHPWDNWAVSQPSWAAPREPFNIISNIYYVGSEGLSSFLITSEQGHVLMDGGLPQNADMIAANIKTLGFDIQDVKILLNSHAHFDHSGGLARLKTLSGAKMIASAADTPWLESGNYPGSTDPLYSAPPVKVDQTIMDQEVVSLGSINLKANLTPGHSPGCTSWSMTASEGGADFDVLFFCSASVAGNKLVNPPQHEGIVADYRKTFDITKDWTPDVFLAGHPFFFDMENKRAAQIGGEPLAFVDRESFPKVMENLEIKFEAALKAQIEQAGN